MRSHSVKFIFSIAMVLSAFVLNECTKSWHPPPWYDLKDAGKMAQAMLVFAGVWSVVFCFVFDLKKKEWRSDGLVLLIIGAAGLSGITYASYVERPKYVVQFANQAIEIQANEIKGHIPKTEKEGGVWRAFALKKSILPYTKDLKTFEVELRNATHWSEIEVGEVWRRGAGEGVRKETLVVGKSRKATVWYNAETKQIEEVRIEHDEQKSTPKGRD
jgi:hypothetical protein